MLIIMTDAELIERKRVLLEEKAKLRAIVRKLEDEYDEISSALDTERDRFKREELIKRKCAVNSEIHDGPLADALFRINSELVVIYSMLNPYEGKRQTRGSLYDYIDNQDLLGTIEYGIHGTKL